MTPLEKLYAKIPSFECKPGCTDCCGPVLFSKAERAKVKSMVQFDETAEGYFMPISSCLDCPFSQADDCSIYEDRPLICRLFGAVDDRRLDCPHGCGPKKKLTMAEGIDIMKEYAGLSQ